MGVLEPSQKVRIRGRSLSAGSKTFSSLWLVFFWQGKSFPTREIAFRERLTVFGLGTSPMPPSQGLIAQAIALLREAKGQLLPAKVYFGRAETESFVQKLFRLA